MCVCVCECFRSVAFGGVHAILFIFHFRARANNNSNKKIFYDPFRVRSFINDSQTGLIFTAAMTTTTTTMYNAAGTDETKFSFFFLGRAAFHHSFRFEFFGMARI